MKTYITFGQIHVHSSNGKTLDKDCVAVINAPDAEAGRAMAMDWFEGKFHNSYSEDQYDLIGMKYYPRGLIEVNPQEKILPEPKSEVSVACTWGEGPDVLITKTYPGRKSQYLDLTIAEAKALRDQILGPLKAAKHLEAMSDAYHAAKCPNSSS